MVLGVYETSSIHGDEHRIASALRAFNVCTLLNRWRVRPTRQRLSLAALFAKADRPVMAENLFADARAPRLEAAYPTKINSLGRAEDPESIGCEQAYALRACYSKLCHDLLNHAFHPLCTEGIGNAVVAHQREIIAQLLAVSPSLNELREDLFMQAYENERRKLAAVTNIAIANAKFPRDPPFSVDEVESQFF